MKKYILLAVAAVISCTSAFAQFVIEKTGGEQKEINSNVVFSHDEATDDYAIGEEYSEENSISNVETIYRKPWIYRVYSQQYEDGSVYVHPYDHYRVDYDDPNCINEYGNVADPNDPFWPGARIVESKPDDVVLILVDFDLGYDNPANHGNDPTGFITVKGLDRNLEFSGSEYSVVWTYREDVGVYGWGLTMPKEAVLVEAIAKELDTYVGEEFVDTYDGFYIHWGAQYANTVASVTTPDVSLELKSNTVFTLQSGSGSRVPDYTYDNRGVYACENNVLSYDEDACKNIDGRDNDGIGVQGIYNEDAWVMTALDLEDGGLDNTYRYFFTVKKSAGITGFTAAANESGNKFLIETITPEGKEYWYYDAPIGQRTLSRVYADFAGKALNEDGAESEITNEAGDVIFKYSYSEGKPLFTFPGREAGTYTDSKGEGGELVLDGFGEGTYDGKAGTYTIDGSGMNVTFTYNEGGEENFIIYPAELTYSKQGTSEVTLDGTFTSGDEYTYIMRVTINSEANTADFYFENKGNVYNDEHGVTYVYDADAKKLVLSGFMMGNPGSWGQTDLRTIDFSVSDDGTTLTCLTDQIQHRTQGPSTCVTILGTVLNKE